VVVAQDRHEIETFQIRRAAIKGNPSEDVRWLSTRTKQHPPGSSESVESTVLLDTSALRSVRVIPQDKGSSFTLVVSFTDAGRAAFDAIWLASINSGRELVWIIDGAAVHAAYPTSKISAPEVIVMASLTEADANRMADHIKQRLLDLAHAESTR
jgi:hypothetical protein